MIRHGGLLRASSRCQIVPLTRPTVEDGQNGHQYF